MTDMKHGKVLLTSRLMNPKFIMVYATIAVFLVIYAIGAMLYGEKGFTTLRTFLNLFIDNAYVGISAVGMTMVIITGGIDLSVGAVASLTGMFIAYGNTILGIDPFLCIAFSILVGVGLGIGMGAMIQYLKVPAFIATLTGMFFSRGICALISRESIAINNAAFNELAKWRIRFPDVKPLIFRKKRSRSSSPGRRAGPRICSSGPWPLQRKNISARRWSSSTRPAEEAPWDTWRG